MGTPLSCGNVSGIDNGVESPPTASPTEAYIEVYTCTDHNNGFHLVGQHDPDNFEISSSFFNVPDYYLNQHVFLWATTYKLKVYYGGFESSMVVSGGSVTSTRDVLIYDYNGSPIIPSSGIEHTILTTQCYTTTLTEFLIFYSR